MQIARIKYSPDTGHEPVFFYSASRYARTHAVTVEFIRTLRTGTLSGNRRKIVVNTKFKGMKLLIRIFFLIVTALLFAQSACASPENDMPCGDESDENSPCIFFPDGTVFLHEGLLEYKGKIRRLKQISSKSLHKRQSDIETSGDKDRFEYAGDKIKATLTQTVLETTCAHYDEKLGRYVDTESCCAMTYQLELKIITPEKTETLKTLWGWGS